MSNSKKIKHLYSRAGFGLSLKEWESKKNWTIQQASQSLFEDAQNAPIHIHKIPSTFIKNMDTKKDKKAVVELGLDWIERMANPKKSAFLERMTLFWHGHFACTSKTPKLAVQQLHSLRKHALGPFKNLVLAIAKDPSMIRFLNNQQNKKDSPNENFARELLELFTIGRGHYTELDVKEAARAFTGWSISEEQEYFYKAHRHDEGRKTFMGKTGNLDGEDIINIVLEKEETAVFITRKIYRYFVNDQADERRVKELANLFYNSNYHIGKLMQHIFQSDWFYDTQNIGTKIKSPIDLMAGIMRSFNVSFKNNEGLFLIQKSLGQELFDPPNVAGWPGAKHWIDNSTLMLRLNLVAYLFQQSEYNFTTKQGMDSVKENKRFKEINATLDLEHLTNDFIHLEESAIIKELMAIFLPLESTSKSSLIQKFSYTANKSDFIKIATMQILSLPEYQMA